MTVLVGLMQWLVGALRLGSLAHFISPSALFGFTSGAAVLIAVHALKDALGLPAPDSHGAGSLLLKLASHAGQAQAGSIIVTLATLGAALLVRRLDKRKPYMLAGLAAGTMAAAAWNAWAAPACRCWAPSPSPGRRSTCPAWTGARCPTCSAWPSR